MRLDSSTSKAFLSIISFIFLVSNIIFGQVDRFVPQSLRPNRTGYIFARYFPAFALRVEPAQGCAFKRSMKKFSLQAVSLTDPNRLKA
jgi:hypothetical protein